MRCFKVIGLITLGLIAIGLGAVPAARSASHIPLAPTSTRPAPMTLTPTETSAASSENVGAYIELHVRPASAVWAVVQWQDAAGVWHEVEGWQGMTDEQGLVRWWVAPAQFRQQPFRWLIYDRPSGRLLGTSRSFALPSAAQQWVVSEVRVQP